VPAVDKLLGQVSSSSHVLSHRSQVARTASRREPAAPARPRTPRQQPGTPPPPRCHHAGSYRRAGARPRRSPATRSGSIAMLSDRAAGFRFARCAVSMAGSREMSARRPQQARRGAAVGRSNPGECERGERDAVRSRVPRAGPISPASGVRKEGCSACARGVRRGTQVAWRPAASAGACISTDAASATPGRPIERLCRDARLELARGRASTVQHVTITGRLLEGHVWGQFGHDPESAPVRCFRRRDLYGCLPLGPKVS
jgi:hypothetical protein